MPTNNIKSKSGFTIIEVVLVLAVAGLIFLMVFIALPALQRSQRDTQRRQAVSQVQAALNQYQSNNSTKADNLPTASVCYFAEGKFDFDDATNSIPTAYRGNGSDGIAIASAGPVLLATSGSSTTTTAASMPNNDACKFVKNYLNESGATENVFLDPDGRAYSIDVVNYSSSFTVPASLDHIMYIVRGGKCDGEGVAAGTGTRNFAVVYKLEGAGVLCLDNS